MTGLFKNSRILWAVVVMAISTLGVSTQSIAADVVVLVVNQNLVFRDSLVGKDSRAKMAAVQEQIANEQKADMEALRTEVQNLIQQRTLLPSDQFKQKQMELAQKEEFIQYKYQQEFQATGESSKNQILAQLYPILQELMQERNGTLLFEQSSLLMASADYDITAEAIKRLDARMPSVKVERVAYADLVGLMP